MPRNRYTKAVRTHERIQIARQIRELARIASSLNRNDLEPLLLPVDGDKDRRRTRRHRMRRDKAKRTLATAAN